MLETLRIAITIVVFISGILAVAFPILYSFSPWYKTRLGRVLMADSVTYAFLLVLTIVFRLWKPDNLELVAFIYLIAFSLVCVTNGALLYGLWRLNFTKDGVEVNGKL